MNKSREYFVSYLIHGDNGFAGCGSSCISVKPGRPFVVTEVTDRIRKDVRRKGGVGLGVTIMNFHELGKNELWREEDAKTEE